ncbi:MAG: tetratricopeptide repeat protein [Candidatus Sulfotelmatobacter sp.]
MGLPAVLLWASAATAILPRGFPPATGAMPPQAASTAASGQAVAADPALLFQRGQAALSGGRLDEAERDFRQVLAANPQVGGAYANLGVVYMRRKQWTQALDMLHQAEHLLPDVAGIRLNIGLVYYRQSEFLKAIPPFESVVRNQPDALQPRYLLGECYFFAERWADAAATLQPLWPQESTQPLFLYMLSMSAHKAGNKELDEKAWGQLIKTGHGDPQFDLLMGKEHLQLEQYDLALNELQAAARSAPRLPFVHFNLGLTYLKKQDYEHARDEFLKDAALEPDLALNYEELGEVYSLMQQDTEAEKNYRAAVGRNPRLVSSWAGLAKIYQREEKYERALNSIDEANKIDPQRTDLHYLRGQILVHMGHKEEGKKELELAVRIANEKRAEREKQVETGTVPSPELVQEQQ